MQSCYSQFAASLTTSLNLAQSPVAVCFADSVPASVPSHAGKVPAGCRFWQDAATSAFATSAADHSLCAIGVYTHHLDLAPARQTDLEDALHVFGDLGYVRAQDLPLIPVLATQPKHVIYAPLAHSPLEPDVVLLVVDARQTLILSEAVQQVEQQNAPAMGRPACAVIPQVMNTGRAALSLGCCGARAYLDVLTDDVALFALPGAKLSVYLERITALAQANSALAKFHRLRRRDVAAGAAPTIKESLAALNS
ncbi:MAG TPA: DUF169 domain-containing protein [Terracidiphilus sp.]|nr:DUF169 domain-containing protein [Terracidiphilus sp.]